MSTKPDNIENLQQEISRLKNRIEEIEKAKKQCEEIAMKTLESSEERHKIIFDLAPDALYLSDLKGNIIEANQTAEKILGQDKKELTGKNFLELNVIKTQDRHRATKILAKNALGLKTGPDKFEVETQTGGRIVLEITTFPIIIHKERLVMGIARDITERVQAEEFRKKNQQRMAFHVDQTTLAVIEWDLNFKVKRWNPAAEKIFGYTAQEAFGQHASFIIPETSMSHVDQIWMEVTHLKGSRRLTNTNRHKNGNFLICEWHNTPLINNEGEVIAVASMALDVTERIRSEEIQKVVYNISNAANTTGNLNKLIHRIQEELASIIDTSNYFIALYNKDEDSLSLPFFADEKDRFTTFPAGKTLTNYVVKNKKSLLATREVIDRLEKSGEVEAIGSISEIWLGVPLEIDNEVIGVLAVQSHQNPNAYNEADMKMLEFVSDQISLSIHRKNSEVKMMDALEKATESDRLKSAFLANLSHEIRTPMNGILGFASLLKYDKINDIDREKYISVIEKCGIQMLDIINDLIDISKIESGITELVISDFDLNHSMDFIYSFFKPEADAKSLKLTVRKGLNGDKALIQSDREKIYAVLINLVKNALKYTKRGEIKFAYKLDNNILRFMVQDTGIGVPEDKLTTIFKRFVQVDPTLSRNFDGVGLGLAISKAYIKLLGGKIWVESKLLQGSTFFVEIPYVKGKTREIEKIEKPSLPDKTKSKLKILIAEDDAINRKLLHTF